MIGISWIHYGECLNNIIGVHVICPYSNIQPNNQTERFPQVKFYAIYDFLSSYASIQRVIDHTARPQKLVKSGYVLQNGIAYKVEIDWWLMTAIQHLVLHYSMFLYDLYLII